MRCKLQTMMVVDRKGCGRFFDRRRSGAMRGRKIGFVGADAHPLDRLDDRFHADLAGGADRHQVARLFEAPADRMLARAARAAEVAEAFVPQIRTLIDAKRPIDDERDRKSTRLKSSHYCASRMPSSA